MRSLHFPEAEKTWGRTVCVSASLCLTLGGRSGGCPGPSPAGRHTLRVNYPTPTAAECLPRVRHRVLCLGVHEACLPRPPGQSDGPQLRVIGSVPTNTVWEAVTCGILSQMHLDFNTNELFAAAALKNHQGLTVVLEFCIVSKKKVL